MRNLVRSLALCAAVLLTACSRPSDEQRIRDAIAAMEAAAQSRNPRDFMEHVAEDFVGRDAGFDRAALHNLLRAQFLRNDKIGVLIGPIEVTLQPPRATARMSVTLTGGSAGLIPERGAIYDVDTGWKQSGGDWQLLSADWRQR